MRQKIVFLDVDGTLTLPTGKISKNVREAIRKTRENGHYVFLCTGRNKAGVSSLMPIGFDGVICSAGGYIEVAGKKIYESCLNNEDLQRARSLFKEHHILYNLETTEMTFQSDEMSKEFFKYQLKDGKMNSEMKRLINEQKNMFNIHTLEEFEQNPLPVQKLCFIAHDEKQLEEPKRLLSDQYNFIIHEIFSEETINGEIIIKGTNKGDAIERVVEYLGLSMQDTIGFGDSMNDYEMIKICHQGIVMENGSKELKKYATSICENVQDDGVYKELKRLGLSD